jgi:hypothetical protein
LERNCFEKVLFRLDCTLLNGDWYVLRKLGLHNYIIMEGVLQILGAFVAAVPVKHPENLDLWPVLNLWNL